MDDVTLTVREVRDEALETKSFLFDADGLGSALAGQYLLVKLDVPDDPRRGSRSFTMANAPSEGFVMITTRIRSSSPFKQKMARLQPGDQMRAKGPLGRFVLEDHGAPVLFLAGGIGVTPFRSMIRHAVDTGRTAPITLVASDRVPEAIPFAAELEGWAKRNRWLRVERTVTRPEEARAPWAGRKGRIDPSWIQPLVGDVGRTTSYIAGPPAFVEATAEMVKSIGWPPERVVVERFIGY